MSILVVAEHDNDSIKAPTLVAVAAAEKIGGDIEVLVAGSACSGAGEAAANIAGVAKVLVADNEAYGHQLAENIGDLVAEIGKGYSHILTPTTTSGKNFMPRVAALLALLVCNRHPLTRARRSRDSGRRCGPWR